MEPGAQLGAMRNSHSGSDDGAKARLHGESDQPNDLQGRKEASVKEYIRRPPNLNHDLRASLSLAVRPDISHGNGRGRKRSLGNCSFSGPIAQTAGGVRKDRS